MKITIYKITFFLFLSSVLFGQPFTVKSFRDFGSVVSNDVNKIFIDSYGFQWIGTARGMARFDGENFITPDNDENLQKWDVVDIYQPHNNYLVVIANQGIAKIGNLQGYPEVIGQKKTPPRKIYYTGWYDSISGNIIVSLFPEKKLLLINDSMKIVDSLQFSQGVTRIASNDSVFALGTESGDLFLSGRKSFFANKIDTVLSGNFESGRSGLVASILLEQESIYYTITGVGLVKVTEVLNRKKLNRKVLDFVSNLALHSIMRDPGFPGRYWVGGQYDGVYYFDDEHVIFHLSIESGLPSSLIHTVYPEVNGRVWFGTQFGIAVLTNKFINDFSGDPDLKDKGIWNVSEINGNIWVGTDAGVYVISPSGENLTHRPEFAFLKKLSQKAIFYFKQIDQNEIWFSTKDYGKIYVFKQGNWSVISPESKYKASLFLTIFKDTQGRVWLGGREIIVIKNGILKAIPMVSDFPDFVTYSITERNNGNILYGTNRGIIETDGNKAWILPGTEDALLDVSVMFYFPDKDELIISAVGGILKKWKNGMLMNYEHIAKIAGDEVFSILYDGKKLFFGTDLGISVLDSGSGEWSYLNSMNGLSNNEINTNSFCKIGDFLWVGTARGLNRISLKLLEQEDIKIGAFVQGFYINGKSTKKMDSVLNLSFKQNNIRIDVGSQVLFPPPGLNYYFYLKGFDEKAVVSRSGRMNYINLPPGEYELVAFYKIRENMFKSNEIRIKFIISSPWFKNPVFIILSVIFLLALFYMIFKIRTRNLERIATKLKSELQEEQTRTNELQLNLENLYRYSKVGIIIANTDGIIRQINRAATEFLTEGGVSERKFIKRSIGSLKIFLENEKLSNKIRSLLKKELTSSEITITLENSKTLLFQFLIIEQHKKEHVFILISDVSDSTHARNLKIQMESYMQVLATLSHYINNTMTILSLAEQRLDVAPEDGTDVLRIVVKYSVDKISFILRILEESVQAGNIKYSDYVNAKNLLIDINEKIENFESQMPYRLSNIQKLLKN